MTDINSINDLIQILQDQPEWRAPLRGMLLSEELEQLPQRVTALEESLASFIKTTDQNFQLVHQRLEQLENDVADLKAGQAQLQTAINQINGRLDNGFGMNYQLKVEKNILSIAVQHLNLRRSRLVRSVQAGFSPELGELIEDALENDILTPEEAGRIGQVDLVIAGRQGNQGPDVYVAAELSITVGDDDINRAAERARILETLVERPVISAVIGAHIDDTRADLAREKGVTVARVPE